MKKTLFLLFVGILPFIGFTQNNPIVSWNGRLINNAPSFKPTYLTNTTDSGISSAALTAQDISSTGVGTLSVVEWELFYGTGWPSNSNVDTGKYFALTVSPKANYQLAINKLVLTYKGNNKKMRVSYSKNANFSNPTNIEFTDLNFYNTSMLVNVVFPTTVNVTSSETLYIRIYGYDNAANGNGNGNGNASSRYWSLQFNANNPTSNVGPTLYGNVTYVGGPQNPVANADAASTLKNVATTINVLANDSHNTLSAITITQSPTNGTVQVNGVNNITYTPNANFTGNDSFKYKLVDNVGTSNVATVSIAVTEPTATNLVRWDGANLQPNAFLISPNVSSGPITSSGNVGFQTLNWGNPNAFHTSEWPSGTNPDYSKYVQFSISANSGYEIALSEFKFNYQVDNNDGPSKFEVRYSTSPSFPSEGTLIYTNDNLTKGTIVPESIPLTGLTVASNQTLYIRIYAYARPVVWSSGTPFRFQHGYNSSNPAQNTSIGPTITGIVSAATEPITKWTAQNNWSNGVPTIIKDAIIESDYTVMPNEVLEVKNLTVNPSAKVTVAKNGVLIVQNDVTVLSNPGTTTPQLIIENDGSFVQIADDANYIGSAESFMMNRKTQPVYRLDFTYWSSPIKESSGYTLKKLSPLTLASKYYKWNDAWVSVNANTEVMVPGKGYIVRAPQNFDIQGQAGAVAKVDSVVFKGLPNNGVVKIPVNGNQKWNLIGNPYPSALSIDEFYNNLNNRNKLQGTVYLWTHNTPIGNLNGTGYYSYSPSDYATYNQTGGTATTMSMTNSQQNLPLGYIASGQSFFVQGEIGGEVEFNNSMRVTQTGLNNQFFKPAPTETVENWQSSGKHRVWLNITNEQQNAFNQALVGYIENATNDLDWGYDGVVFSGGSVMLYSILGDKNLTIQGKALPFSNQDEVPLGYQTTLTGTLKISIDHVDGLFEGQNVYLKDNVTGIVHNLKDSDYTFTTVPGTFNDRFVLRYLPQEDLSTNIPVVDENSIVVFNKNNQVSIKSAEQTINSVEVYDLQGRVLLTKNNIKSQDFTTQTLSVSNQVVLVKVITENSAELVKKVMLK